MKQGWEIKKLGEVCDFYRGLTYSKKDEVEISSTGVLRSNNIDLANNQLNLEEIKYISDSIIVPKDKKIKKGSLLICTANGSKSHLGKVALIDEDYNYAFGGFMGLMVPHKQIMTPKYFYYSLITSDYKNYIKKLSDGANINNLKFKDLQLFEIPVPSLLEQGRIVEVLDAAFAKIDALKENAQKNLENAKALFQQVLKQELTPKPNWQTKKLGEIALKKLSYGASVPSRNFDGEYRYIRITDIDEDGKLLNDLVSPAVCEEKHILHSGDLLLARTGGTIGKSYLYSPEDGKCIYAGYLIRVIVNQDIVLPEFVFFNTKTDRYWNFIKKSQKTAAQPNINAQQYSSFDIPYPSKDEQEGIVRKIKSIFTKQKQLEKCCQKTIAECDALKQAVLRRAFNGEL